MSRALHPLVGFVAGWVSLIAGFTGAIAFAATAFESYLLPASLRPNWLPNDLIAVGAVVVGGLCHAFRARTGAVWQNVAVALKLVLLAIFLGAVAYHQDLVPMLVGTDSLAAAIPASRPELATFGGSLVWISLSYSGFNAAVYVAGETPDAKTIVPRAMIAGTLITTLLYVLLNAVFVFGVEPQAIAGQPDVAVIAAEAIGGPRLANFVRIIICVALMTSVMSMMMAAPRVYAKMAGDGMMPSALQVGGASTPSRAIFLQVVLASVIILVSKLNDLLSYLGLTLSVTAAMTVCCLLLPNVRKQCRIPLLLPIAIFYIVATLAAGIAQAKGDVRNLIAMGCTFLVGAIVYRVSGRNSNRKTG